MTRRLYVDAAKAMKYGGASEELALRMITLNPARHLELDDRIGSIEVGKDADLAIYTAHPFSADTQVQMTLVDGQIYFDRDKVETTGEALQTLESSPRDVPGDEGGLDDRFAPWTAPAAPSTKPGYGDIDGPAVTAAATIAITGGRVVTMAGPPIEGGTVLVRNGRIAAVGDEVDVPASADVIDARGLVVSPGIINAGTTLGISEIGAVSATQDVREIRDINASVKASVAVHPHSAMLPVTRANGVTTALTAPGGGLISGQAAVIDMDGWTAPEVVAASPVAMVIDFPESGALSPDEEALEGIANDRRTLRDWMRRARAYAGAIASGRTEASGDDDELRALVPVVRGELPVLLQAESEEGILAALEFAGDFDLDAVLEGTRDVWRVVDAIAAASVPVILGPLESRPAPGDPYDAVFAAAALLQEAGVPYCFRTGGATNARNLPYTAAMAVGFGLSREHAWRAMTLGAAEVLGVADDYGSLEVGKVANVVVADGDLLDVPTQVRHVLIRGRRVDLSSRHTELYQRFKARPTPTAGETDANP
jgi:imidazolonepropionase-like amidohydrolase